MTADEICYGHHVWAGKPDPDECLRCGFLDLAPQKPRRHPVVKPSIAQLLDFAAAHPGKVNGAVDEQLRRELGIPAVRYLQLLSRAIDTVEALEHDPLTTRRLRREAAHRARAREARTGH